MAIKLSTVSGDVTINDLGARTFVHPTTNYDLVGSGEFTESEIKASVDLQTLVTGNEVTLKDGNDNPITNLEEAGPHNHVKVDVTDFAHGASSHSGTIGAHSNLSGVGADDHHAQSHSHSSHSGIGANDHHAQTHTHASHTSIGVDDHHNRDHAATHGPGAQDALKLDDLAVPDDNTDLDASTSKHGLLLKLGGGASNFFRADGTWNPSKISAQLGGSLLANTPHSVLNFSAPKISAVDGGGGIANIAIPNVPLHKVHQVSANYSPTVAQLEANGPVIVVDTTAGNVTVTLPKADTIPVDGHIRQLWLHNVGGGNICKVVCNTETFQDGMSSLVILRGLTANIGGFYAGPGLPGWLRTGPLPQRVQVRRAATWAAINFATAAALPFDAFDTRDNQDVLDWVVGTPTRITAKYTGRYTFNYTVSIDSTGGGSYSIESWLRKNGTTDILGSYVRTGNYSLEDQSMSKPGIEFDLVANDYVALMLHHSGLTGMLLEATLFAQVGGA